MEDCLADDVLEHGFGNKPFIRRVRRLVEKLLPIWGLSG